MIHTAIHESIQYWYFANVLRGHDPIAELVYLTIGIYG